MTTDEHVAAAVALDRTKLLAARFRAAHDRPYFSTALFSLSVVPSWTVPTMGVDRHWRCYVSPGFVDATPVEELAAVWIHEAAHLLRDHHGRAALLRGTEGRDHRRVNVAQDCEINDDLLADRLSLPADRVDPAGLGLPEGLMFEQYVAMLPPTPHAPDCGSGAHGIDSPWEIPGTGGTGVGETEAGAIRRETARSIRDHIRSRGTVPGGWQRWAEAVLEPVIDWRRALTGAVREAAAWASGAVDYTYHRPSRRSAALRGVVLPSLRRPMPRVAVVIDTSGSMGESELSAALAEVTGVLRAVGIGGNRITVLACDASVHVAQRIASAQEITLAGGGGTDMRVGIAAALAARDRPQFVIVLTDGYTPWPDQPLPGARLIAGIIGAQGGDAPGWAASVRIPSS